MEDAIDAIFVNKVIKHGIDSEPGHTFYSCFLHNVLAVGHNGVLADVEPVGDFFVSQTLRHEYKHGYLPARQFVSGIVRCGVVFERFASVLNGGLYALCRSMNVDYRIECLEILRLHVAVDECDGGNVMATTHLRHIDHSVGVDDNGVDGVSLKGGVQSLGRGNLSRDLNQWTTVQEC